MAWPSDRIGGFPGGDEIAEGARVKLSAGVLALAGAADHDIGVVESRSTGGHWRVRYRNAPGPHRMLASEEIAAGALVYAADNGKVATSGTLIVGTALEAGGGDGATLTVLRGADPIVSN